MKPFCFVLMPFGQKKDEGGRRRLWSMPACSQTGKLSEARHQERKPDMQNDWTKPAAMAIPEGGFFKDRVEQGRYGPIFPKTPACYGFSIIAKIIPGREENFYEYGRNLAEGVAGTPDLLASLKLHYLRWNLFKIKGDTYFQYMGIFDTDFDKYTEDAVAIFKRACVSAEFRALAANQSSPVTQWLRSLARLAHQECGGPGVGAIGMCFTGNFALSMMLEPSMLAPVMSQPSLPLNDPAGMAMAADELATVRERLERDDLTVMAYRFAGDKFCRAQRFAAFSEALGDRFVARAKKWQLQFPIVGTIHGMGAMRAIEMVRSKETLQPADKETQQVVKYCYEHGVITISAGTYGNVIRLLMPLVISNEQFDEAMSVLESALQSVATGHTATVPDSEKVAHA